MKRLFQTKNPPEEGMLKRQLIMFKSNTDINREFVIEQAGNAVALVFHNDYVVAYTEGKTFCYSLVGYEPVEAEPIEALQRVWDFFHDQTVQEPIWGDFEVHNEALLPEAVKSSVEGLVELISEDGFITSTELARICVGEKKDAHSNFMKKAEKVLGEGIVNFYDTYIHEQNGQTYKCLSLPEREACLMAMSYSYELQAKVYDAYTEFKNTLLDIGNDETASPQIVAKVEKAMGTTFKQLAQKRAGMLGIKRAPWKNELLKVCMEKSPVEAAEMFLDMTSSKEVNSLRHEDRADLLAQAKATLKEYSEDYRKNAIEFRTHIYHEFQEAINMLGSRREMVLQRRNTQLNQNKDK